MNWCLADVNQVHTHLRPPVNQQAERLDRGKPSTTGADFPCNVLSKGEVIAVQKNIVGYENRARADYDGPGRAETSRAKVGCALRSFDTLEQSFELAAPDIG